MLPSDLFFHFLIIRELISRAGGGGARSGLEQLDGGHRRGVRGLGRGPYSGCRVLIHRPSGHESGVLQRGKGKRRPVQKTSVRLSKGEEGAWQGKRGTCPGFCAWCLEPSLDVGIRNAKERGLEKFDRAGDPSWPRESVGYAIKNCQD